MTGGPAGGTRPGPDGQRTEGQPPPAGGAIRDWFHLVAFEWMWRDDGLALRPGPELMVYATIYRASAHGGGAFYATNASMGRMLGYPRETVNRTVRRLLESGLVWVVGTVSDGHGGRPVRCYAVSQGPIDRAQARISAHLLDAQEANGPTAQADGNLTCGHVASGTAGGSFRQGVTNDHVGSPQCDLPSRPQCDGASHVTERHIAENDLPPARTGLFDIPLISTYHLSTDQAGTGDGEQAEGACEPRLVGAADMLAFRSLLRKSVLPVDDGYVDRNLKAFARLVGEGIPADVILSAYDDYAAYQRRMEAELGESRPMHLLKWLNQSPNKNIQYVLNSRDEQWCREHPSAARKGRGRDRAKAGRKPRPTHESPDLVRCRDRGTAMWFVTDERGSRAVDGSRGVESMTQARGLYERMYEREGRRADG